MTSASGPNRRRSDIDAAILLVRQQGLAEAGVPTEASFLPGGSISVVVLVTTGDGQQWVVKQVPGSLPSMLRAEAEGLQALGASATVAVPFVHYAGGRSLIMDAPGPTLEDSAAFWQCLGEDIAALQASTRAEQHGRPHDNWLGGLPQRNAWDADGYRFFAEHRVQRYLEEPKVRQALSAGDLKAVEPAQNLGGPTERRYCTSGRCSASRHRSATRTAPQTDCAPCSSRSGHEPN
jgi:fructosamine-3-kinase